MASWPHFELAHLQNICDQQNYNLWPAVSGQKITARHDMAQRHRNTAQQRTPWGEGVPAINTVSTNQNREGGGEGREGGRKWARAAGGRTVISFTACPLLGVHSIFFACFSVQKRCAVLYCTVLDNGLDAPRVPAPAANTPAPGTRFLRQVLYTHTHTRVQRNATHQVVGGVEDSGFGLLVQELCRGTHEELGNWILQRRLIPRDIIEPNVGGGGTGSRVSTPWRGTCEMRG